MLNSRNAKHIFIRNFYLKKNTFVGLGSSTRRANPKAAIG